MSVQRVESAISSLQSKNSISVADVETLKEATGDRISEKEYKLITDFVSHHESLFESQSIPVLLQHFQIVLSAPPLSRMNLSVTSVSQLPLKEASAIIPLSEGLFLVADDEKGIFLCQGNQAYPILERKEYNEMVGIEGITLSPDGKNLLMVSENDGKIFSSELEMTSDRFRAKKPKEISVLSDIQREHNKGWEGIAILPQKLSFDGTDKLIAIHEGSPRKLGIFSFPNIEEETLLSLPDSVKTSIPDISDVCISPKTGHILILSDQSETIAELRLVTKKTPVQGGFLHQHSLEWVQSFDLPELKGKKPEGLSFSPDGSKLFVIAEKKGTLLELQVNFS